ncbi:SMP-30/gluconolactonase/LRE family protein [Pseudonocardia ailaonensis]|uniref:SMP-30/gluconolactonase/LRE family protein n=1 Tax=Pseudonocardia ailaonensis TaxID=367279 RepID=A0ABN2MR86_9PSEU
MPDPTLTSPAVPLVGGLRFAEAPRWHAGRLWFSDIFGHRVLRVDEAGNLETVHEFADGEHPCGLGFLPDGRLLVANMARPQILRLDAPGEVAVHADLAELAVGGLNDMVVDAQGRAYVGSMGTHDPAAPRPVAADGRVILVEPDGSARVVATEVDDPNGPVLLPDGTYVVASFPSARLIGFDREPDGRLTNRRVWADLAPGSADGIAADREGAIWTASPLQGVLRRIVEGGTVTDVVPISDDITAKMPLACALGGHDGRTLFVLCLLGGVEAIAAGTTESVVETVRVAVPAS